MKIAITGGAGFIGDALARRLHEDGHELVIIDRDPSPSFPEKSRLVDIRDRDALTRALEGVEAVYHLAAEHHDDIEPKSLYYEVNVGGTENLIAACRRHNIRRLLFTSTVAVYGLDAGESREDSPTAPFNDYGASKLEAERLLERWAAEEAATALPRGALVGAGEGPDPAPKPTVKDEGPSLTILRLVAVFGPGNRGNLHNLLTQIHRNRFVMVGPGRNRKSLAYLGNVVALLAHGLALPAGSRTYNYADKPDFTTERLVSLARETMGRSSRIPRIPYSLGLIGGLAFDALGRLTGRTYPISAIRIRKFCAETVVTAEKYKETGFTPPHTIDSGLTTTIEEQFTPLEPRLKQRVAR